MTHIKQTDIVPPHMIVAAKMFHQGRGEERVRAARMYMVSNQRDGSGMQEYLLTRYVNRLGVAMSSILKMELPPSSASADATSLGDGGFTRRIADAAMKKLALHEICREDRKHEEQMIMAWCTGMGGTTCETEYLI